MASKFLIQVVVTARSSDDQRILASGIFTRILNNVPDEDELLAQTITRETDKGVQNWCQLNKALFPKEAMVSPISTAIVKL